MKILLRLSVIVIFLNCIVCTNTVNIDNACKRYCKSPYIQEWNDGCIKISSQLLTPELLASMEFRQIKKKVNKAVWDSVVNKKRETGLISFRMRIDPIGKCIDTVFAHNSDIVYGFGRSDKEREQEIQSYNFSLDKRIWLNFKNKKIIPCFSHLEHNFGMDNGRDIWVGFMINEKTPGKNKNEDVILFFQKPTPVCDMASIKWSSSVMEKMLCGGRL